jgi:hypothetical protein
MNIAPLCGFYMIARQDEPVFLYPGADRKQGKRARNLLTWDGSGKKGI